MSNFLKNKKILLGVIFIVLALSLVGSYLGQILKLDALREISTGAFSGGFIGLILLWYEEIREGEREKYQVKRDQSFAQELSLQNKRLVTLQEMHNIWLTEIDPHFWTLLNTAPVQVNESSAESEFFNALQRLQYLSTRISDLEFKRNLVTFTNESRAYIDKFHREHFFENGNSYISEMSLTELKDLIWQKHIDIVTYMSKQLSDEDQS